MDDFYEASGLKLNDKKTEALWIGSKRGSSEVQLPERNFKWPNHKVKALGVWLSVDPETTATLNYDEKLEKVRNTLSCWKYRRLTPIGKITVQKSLVVSQLVYVLSPLRLNVKAIKEVNKRFFPFLWNGKGDKIKRNVIINDYPCGGLRIIDIFSFSKSLKATWIQKYLDKENQGKWKLFFDLDLEAFGGTAALTGNLNTKGSVIVSEILTFWAEVNFEDRIISKHHFLDQSLWHNSLIRIDNCPIFYPEWHREGVTKVKHLKDDSFYLSKFALLSIVDCCPRLNSYGTHTKITLLQMTLKTKVSRQVSLKLGRQAHSFTPNLYQGIAQLLLRLSRNG